MSVCLLVNHTRQFRFEPGLIVCVAEGKGIEIADAGTVADDTPTDDEFTPVFACRPAAKNQSRSPQEETAQGLFIDVVRDDRPAIAYDTPVTAFLNGVTVVHALLLWVSRARSAQLIAARLFVIVLTTPPVNRPYSAEIAPLRTVVSCTASSTKRLCTGCGRSPSRPRR